MGTGLPRNAIPPVGRRIFAQFGIGKSSGFSLIEMMVGLVVSLIGTAALMSVFATFEAKKRTTTSANDAQQNGSYASYELERQIRTAGSGLIQGNRYGVWGCSINAHSAGAAILPSTASYPSPFTAWPNKILAVPVLIANGGTDANGNALSDTIAVVAGNPAVRTFKSQVSVGGTTVQLDNTFGMNGGDYLLNTDTLGNCWLGLTSSIAFFPAPAPSQHDSATLVAANSPTGGFASGYVFDMGAQPTMTLYGVNAAASPSNLVSYDLLQRGPAGPVSVADGVVAIKALYGVDATASCPTLTSFVDTNFNSGTTSVPNVFTNWYAPVGSYSLASLTASNLAACTAMAQIKMVRLAVVVQSELPERAQDYTGPSSVTLFGDLPTLSVTISTNTQYRYKVYDTIIPVRNAFIDKLY